jgi:hypothetical protein
MAPDDRRRTYKRDLLLAAAMIVAGVAVSGVSLAQIAAKRPQQLAQGTPSLQGTPAPDSSKTPADPEPGGARPTTPAPEPARPDAKAQQEGAQPALPPAPAEKTAAPIQQK